MASVCFIDFRSWEIHIVNIVSSFMGILSAQKVPFIEMIFHSLYSIDMAKSSKLHAFPPLLCFSSPQTPCPRDRPPRICTKPHFTVTVPLSHSPVLTLFHAPIPCSQVAFSHFHGMEEGAHPSVVDMESVKTYSRMHATQCDKDHCYI